MEESLGAWSTSVTTPFGSSPQSTVQGELAGRDKRAAHAAQG